ncbi:DsbA family protein [Loktanella agnita]|uniref:DsbA family protein n=1 Tax=Loktanella agnita TaxID=287097 RepID=UPI0039856C04
MTLRHVLPAVIALGTPAAALDLDAMTEAERTAFGAEVRAYILENPTIIREAIGVLQAREQAEQAAADTAMAQAATDALFNDGYSFVGGNPDGDITIVEFLDYSCGYCKRAFPEVESLVSQDGNIRFIVKELPILGEQSVIAAQFAVATQIVMGDETYKQVHDTLMEFRGDINTQSLTRLSDTLGLETQAIFAKMGDEAVTDVINANRALAQQLQISGTPTFIIDDQMLRGYVPLADMEQIVASLRDD